MFSAQDLDSVVPLSDPVPVRVQRYLKATVWVVRMLTCVGLVLLPCLSLDRTKKYIMLLEIYNF